MAFFGIFGNKGIDSLSVDEIKKERLKFELKLSISLKKYEQLGKKVRDVLLQSKNQNRIQKQVTATRYKAVKRDWQTQGKETSTLNKQYAMLTTLLFIKENYEQLEKNGAIAKIMNDKNLDEKLTNMAMNVTEMDKKLDDFVTTFDSAAEGLGGESFGDVIELGEDLEALEKDLK
tara:strand:- start:994 stop:1518 length:525 start_codon:yes stop_codon:yes gene_type:complete